MRLKRLELFGFKSFADRTALDFHKDLTGVVGPNGCGKSNVVDAVRWVLGEQRPTSMRGGEMIDVIFKGSSSRPAMSVAEVSLVLDNAAEELAGRGTEVSITRRVFKSGEGEYLINGERVRLKDVRDMLFDTGLGSRGYAVLEQGRIDAVLSANPVDRRAIFEEAAGVSRFRQRKKETEARLKRVEADVQRLDDVLRELATRVRSLKIQAGKAERFVAARDEWRRERGRLLKHRLFAHNSELTTLREALSALEGRARSLRGTREGGASDVAEREREQASLAAEVDRLADEVARLSGEGRALDERHAQLSARIQAWRASAEEESGRALQLASQLETREAELESVERELELHIEELRAAEDRASAHAELLRGVRGEYRDLRAASEEQNASVLRLLHEKTAAQNGLHHIEDARGPLDARRERAAERLAASAAALAELAEQASESERRALAARIALEESEAEMQRLREAFAALERESAEGEAQRKSLELERARLSSRIAALRDIDSERSGLEAGARALLSGVGAGAPCEATDLSGVLADSLRTSTELARALDAALGERALGLVTRSPELAGRIVRWLKDTRAGQVRLLCAAGAPPVERAALPKWSAKERDLAAGRLMDGVQCAAEFEPLAEFLVGDVIVARDLDAAQALVAAHPRWRFVTREGDLIDAGGLVGGHRDIVAGAVGRRSSADELERELERVAARFSECDARLAGLASDRERCVRERTAHEQDFESRRQALSEAQRESHTARARLSDLEQAHQLSRREAESIATESARLEHDLDELRARFAQAEQDFVRENAVLSTLDERRRSMEARRDEMQRQEQALEVDVARVGAEREGLARRTGDLKRVCGDCRLELDRARRLVREQTASADAAAEDVATLRDRADLLLVERGTVEERLAELRRTERAGREAIEGFRRRVDAVTHELEGLLDAIAKQKLDLQRVEMEKSEALSRAQEELSLGESELLEGFVPEPELALEGALAGLDARVAEQKRELDRIGAVNTEAMAELAEAEGRFAFLDGQRKDLTRSRLSLAETLATINEESVRLFLETFEEVRGHFQQLFRQLFGGGRADLELQAGIDPLEAGIEISARPPGREMLPIGLLSGGQRTMTALALLFAVFKARPSPFCVLDEVDAALDDANIGRFLGMLDHFRRGTQFIVVTHNKGTMAACEGLYGITMETKGVSRHVSVEFGDVERFDPQTTGDAAAASRARDETRARTGERPDERSGADDGEDDPPEDARDLRPASRVRDDDPERAAAARDDEPHRAAAARDDESERAAAARDDDKDRAAASSESVPGNQAGAIAAAATT